MLNYFINRATNAAAESLNSKLKGFRAQLRGVSDLPFFMYIESVKSLGSHTRNFAGELLFGIVFNFCPGRKTPESYLRLLAIAI